jgi:hypothetical protein
MTHPSGTGYERDLYTIEGLPPETSQVLERRFMKAVDQSASDTVERLLEHRFEAEARLGSLPSHLMRVLLKCELSVRFLTNRPVTPNWAMSDTIATNDGHADLLQELGHRAAGCVQPRLAAVRGRLGQLDTLPRLTATGRSRTIAVATAALAA